MHAPPAHRPQILKGSTASKLKQEEATAANVASPKGISKKTPAGSTSPADTHTAPGELGKARRRLSVVSDNKLVDGMAAISTDDLIGENEADTAVGKALVVTAYAGVSKKGYAPYNPRKKNQDALVMASHDATNSLLLCVFDGHGEVGDLVSQYFKAHLSENLFNHALFNTTGTMEIEAGNIQSSIAEVLSTLEKKLLRDATVDTEFSGTTGVVCVLRGSLLVVGNVGDSRITRGYQGASANVVAEQVSSDHKPDRPDEKKRILSVGGRVFAVEYDDGIDGPPRVWLGHMDVPGLAMSRSLGDTVAHSAGVSSEPEFFVRKLDDKDRFLVIATDGLWEFMSDQEVMDIIASQPTEPKKAVDLLITEANNRWMKEEQVIDDTTVIVATIKASN